MVWFWKFLIEFQVLCYSVFKLVVVSIINWKSLCLNVSKTILCPHLHNCAGFDHCSCIMVCSAKLFSIRFQVSLTGFQLLAVKGDHAPTPKRIFFNISAVLKKKQNLLDFIWKSQSTSKYKKFKRYAYQINSIIFCIWDNEIQSDPSIHPEADVHT